MLPLFEQNIIEKTVRKTIINHSINGSFAIRKDKSMLIMALSSGGWSYPNHQ